MFQTHRQGAVGEMRVAADLLKRGYDVLAPLAESGAYDLVAHDGAEGWWRVQVKSVTISDGAMRADLRRRVEGGTQSKRRANDECDVVALFCRDTEDCYYLEAATLGSYVTLRVESERDMRSIRWASDHEGFPPSS